MIVKKPPEIFDRGWEWQQLTRFVSDARPEMTLGIVSGRRRQGKSTLLAALAHATGGFYYEAIDGNRVEILGDLGDKLARHLGAPAPFAFASSEEALAAIENLGTRGRPVGVVIDEFPSWAMADPAVASLVRNMLGPQTRLRSKSRTRLILCGSALAVMGGLLAGQAPLRGRAGLELVIPAFDFRTARRFWDLDDRNLATRVFSIVGGTPAYRREFVADDVPKGPSDFDPWVARTVMSPAVPLFREARYLLAEDSTIGDRGLYHSVLGAIAAGETTSTKIAGRIGRPATALAHPLAVLADAGFVTRQTDAFHANKVHYSIIEPLIAFHHAILRPAWAELERPGRARRVWQEMQATFRSKVVGPTFEAMCRTWVARHAARETFDGPVSLVGRGIVPDAGQRKNHEVDVVVLGEGKDVRVLGEAKWGESMTLGEVERLRRIQGLLTARGYDTQNTKLALFAGAGFSSELGRHARRVGLVLVDLERLYAGS